MRSSVLAVVVCYNPDIDVLAESLSATASQVAQLLIVDNGSSNLLDIEKLVEQLAKGEGLAEKIRLLPQGQNLGLGAAHNVGIRLAQQESFQAVLLMDQDSVPLAGMVDNLSKALTRKQLKNSVSAVGACYLNSDNGAESFFVRFGKLKFRRHGCASRDSDGCIQSDFLISSGSLLPLSAIDEIGLMDELLFIDHVDTEWFLRARSKSHLAYGVCDAMMKHGLGEQTHKISLGRERNVPQHKPFRYYYIFRNSINLYKRGYVSALWKWNDFQRLCMIFVMFGLITQPRLNNLKMMLRGGLDGLRGVSGPVELD